MIEIDIRIIYSLVGLTSILLGFLILILKRSSPQVPGSEFWVTGCFLQGGGLIQFAAIPWPNHYLSFLISTSLIISGITLFYTGIHKFKGKRIKKMFNWGIPVFAILVNIITLFFQELNTLRITINSIVLALLGFLIVYELLTPHDKVYNTIFRINGFSFLLFGLVMLVRAVFAKDVAESGVLNNNGLNLFVILIAVIVHALLTYGFIIMVSIRIAEDLKKQVGIRDKFLSIMAHDLKNQINIINGFSELLHHSVATQNIEKSKQFTAYIKQAASQVTGLLNNLLEWARIKSKLDIFTPERVVLHEVIMEETALNFAIAANKEIDLRYTQQVENLLVDADRNMLKTIIRNLIINAIKFTNLGGIIQISVLKGEQTATITVTDSGVGMQPETISGLFCADIIHTTEGTQKESGSGLGLILCKELVERNGGKIWVESEFEKGSSFHFTLPLYLE